MRKQIIAMSNHGEMIGGGEYSFLDLLSNLPGSWGVLALVPERGELTFRLTAKGIETKATPFPSLRPWNLLDMLLSFKAQLNLCRRNDVLLIYANGSRVAFYGGIAGRILGLPVIWHCRIAEPDLYLDPLLCALSTCIVVNSKATAKRFVRGASRKSRVVYNGVDLDWLREEEIRTPEWIRPDWTVILIVARASRWKRHDLALSAFEQVAGRTPSAHLVCVGAKDNLESEWWRYLQDQTQQSPFSKRIHWVGHAEDIRPWYKAAHVLILPSENEPFGRVLVEAMSFGRPVIASRDGGVPEVVRDGLDGILVSPGNAEEMADAIMKIMHDDAMRQRLVKSALERAEVFSLNNHVKAMVEVFEECLRK
jgi:L-malate glycosyltransferase